MTLTCCLLLFTTIVLHLATTAQTASFGHDVAADSVSSSTRTGYACEGSTLSIVCPPGFRVFIQRANYGRFNPSICNEGRNPEGWDLQCMSTRSLSIVTELCDGRIGQCSVLANNRLFGEPCSLTPKYLEVQFRCEVPQKATSPTPVPPTKVPDVFDDNEEENVEVIKSADPTSSSLPSTLPSSTPSSTVTTTSPSTTTTSTSTTSSPVAEIPSSTVVDQVHEDDLEKEDIDSYTELNDAADDNDLVPRLLPVEAPIEFCESVNERHVIWPKTLSGTTVEMMCPNNNEVKGAIWECGSNPVAWVGRPDLSRCVSDSIANIQALVDGTREQFSARRLEILAEDLEAFTEMEEDVFGGDLTGITSAMQEAVDQITEHIHHIPTPVAGNRSTQLMQKMNDAVLTTSSYLLDDERAESWMDLPQATQAETATKLISIVENSAHQLAKKCEQPTVIVNVTMNIVMEIKVVDVSGSAPVEDAVFPRLDPANHNSWSGGGDSIRLTGETIRQLGVEGLAKMIFATYSNLDRYLHQQVDDSGTHTQPREIRPKPTLPQQYANLPTKTGGRLQDVMLMDYSSDVDGGIEMYSMTVSYENDKLSDDLTGKTVNTKIISASFGDRSSSEKHVPLKEPVIYTLEHLTKDNVVNPSCSFWEFSEKSLSGKWSTFGCEIVDTNLTHTTCACQHLTNFAVLMSVKNPAEKLSEGHAFTLSLITYCGCLLSIVCLAAAFFSFCFKNLQNDRNTIHKNLVASLFVAEVVFLLGIVQHQTPLLCSVIAGVLHYLFLAAFSWMCLEGIQIYIMLVEVFEAEKSRIGWFYAAGYGIPAIIVGVSVAIFPGGYGTPYHCWLKVDHGFIWSFVGPVCAIICLNVIMLTIAMYVMGKNASSSAANWKTKDSSVLENIRVWIKGAIVLIVLLGPTWIVGVFYVNTQFVVMAYAFTILNSLQGVFIFVFHCLMNEKVMKEYKRWVRHTSWLPSNLRMRCGGTKATMPSTSPNNSSASGVNRIISQPKLSLEYLTRLLSNRYRKRSSTSTLPSSSNTIKRNGYMIQRNSSGRDSAHLTDSGIVCGHNEVIDESSHIYSEPMTEDPSAYLDPVRIRLDPDEETYWHGGDSSMIEGSVVDTDYLDDFGRAGVSAATRQTVPRGSINIDNYKIRPPPPTLPLPAVPIIAGPSSSTLALNSLPFDSDVYRSDESLLRHKLLALGDTTDDYNDGDVSESSVCSSASTLMINNLNKSGSDADNLAGRDDSGLSAPNITKTPPLASTRDIKGRVNRAMVLSLQRSLPSLYPMPTHGESATSPVENSRMGHASVGCALDVVSSNDNSPSVKPRR